MFCFVSFRGSTSVGFRFFLRRVTLLSLSQQPASFSFALSPPRYPVSIPRSDILSLSIRSMRKHNSAIRCYRRLVSRISIAVFFKYISLPDPPPFSLKLSRGLTQK